MYYNQQSNNFSLHDKTLGSFYGKCTVCTVNVCHLQVLAMHKKILSY